MPIAAAVPCAMQVGLRQAPPAQPLPMTSSPTGSPPPPPPPPPSPPPPQPPPPPRPPFPPAPRAALAPPPRAAVAAVTVAARSSGPGAVGASDRKRQHDGHRRHCARANLREPFRLHHGTSF